MKMCIQYIMLIYFFVVFGKLIYAKAMSNVFQVGGGGEGGGQKVGSTAFCLPASGIEMSLCNTLY